MPEELTPAPQPQKRATARPQVYIEVALADGQKFLFDITTATELKSELGAALASLAPPPSRPPRRPAKKRSRRNGK